MKLDDELPNDETDPKIYTEEDFIFCKKPNGEITSCGFRIQSQLLEQYKSPDVGYSQTRLGGEEYADDDDVTFQSSDHAVSEMFRNKSMPLGIFYMPSHEYSHGKSTYEEEDRDDIDDDLYDKLMTLANDTKQRRLRAYTRKLRVGGAKRKTRSSRE